WPQWNQRERRMRAARHPAGGEGKTPSARPASPSGGAKLPAFRLEHVVEAPLGELDAGREPEIPCFLHVLNDAAQCQCGARTTDDVRVHGKGDVARPIGRLRIKLIEIRLPGLEPVIGVAVFAVAMPKQRAVPERLSRQLD